MKGIEQKNIFNFVQPMKSQSSYFQKNNKSFEKIMKDSQSLQTVQPKENKKLVEKNSDENSTFSKLENLIEKLNDKIDEIDYTKNEDLNSVIDLLSFLQTIIQKQLESLTQESGNTNSTIEQSALTIPDKVLLTDSKGFMDAILAADNQQNVFGIDSMEDINDLAPLLSTIFTKLIDSLKVDKKSEETATIAISETEITKFMSVIKQFLDDKGVDVEQINKLTERMSKLISNPQMKIEDQSDQKTTMLTSNENEVDTVQSTKLNISETDNGQASFSNQSFTGDSIKQFALYIGKSTSKTEASQFVRDFQNIIQKSAFTNEMGQQKIFIKLFPENLGRISIELVKNEHGLAATIIASSAKAKELLQSNMDGLKQSFQLNNLQIDKIDIYQSLQADRSTSYLNQEREQQKQNQQSNQNQSKQSNSDEEVHTSFLDELMKVSL